jgi:hypothetical protein
MGGTALLGNLDGERSDEMGHERRIRGLFFTGFSH